ncbi:hypothetical protein BASA81_000912 [Batrachochytrium salamandrivorans]|nr:hypothetical protein BASA81_000912 [Batrachochytrium salamandrivorans]
MLTRQGIAPLEHIAGRIADVKRVSKLVTNWGVAKSPNRRTSSFKRYKMSWRQRSKLGRKAKAVVVRKAKKRLLGNVLPASHTYLSKRMRMTDRSESWFGTRTGLHSRSRGVESLLTLCRDGSTVLRDVSHEHWFAISIPSASANDGLLTATLQRLFDPNMEAEEFERNELTCTDMIVHEVDAFPSRPLCPVRFWRVSKHLVRIAVHSFAAELFWKSLLVVQSPTVHVQRLVLWSTFLVLGKHCNQVCEVSKPPTPLPLPSVLCCPLTNKSMASEEAFSKYFFSKQFGAQLQHELISLDSNVQSITMSLSTPADDYYKLDFMLGRKKQTQLPACLVVVGQPAVAKLAFLRLAKRVTTACVGHKEFDLLSTYLRIPSFPRDYPDTEAHKRFWDAHALVSSTQWNRLPKSKRGSHVEPQWIPNFVSQASSPDDDEDMVVVRGWNYIKDFLDSPIDQCPQNVWLRAFVTAPRSNKFGPRFSTLASMYLPTCADYDGFVRGSKPERNRDRTRLGQLSSVRRCKSECVGIGHNWEQHF